MRHRWLSLLLGGAVVFVLLWLALGVEAFSRLAPPGSDELKFQPLPNSPVRFTYRLPRGQTWSGVIDRLTNQGWIIYDNGERVLWPDIKDESRAYATFWKSEWFNLLRQWLTVRRDKSDPRVFTVEVVQCIRIVPGMPCA